MANTYYISPTGSDTAPGDGTLAHPWLTISKAYTSSASGDTIYMLPGTYAHYAVTVSRTFTGVGTFGTIIWDFGSVAGGITCANGSTISCNNIKFINAFYRNYGAIVGFPVFSAGDSGSDSTPIINLTNCWFASHAGGPLHLFGAGGYYTGLGGTVNVINSLIDLGTLYNVDLAYGNYTAAGKVNIIGCTIFAINSSFKGTYSYIFQSSEITTMKNTILYGPGGNSINLAGSAGTVTTTNSCVFGNVTNNAGTKVNCITTDPLFIDAAGGNYNLRPTSPCIGTGIIP
jgi:hypothetical protein